MTQKEVIKEKMANGEWICGTWFMENYVPEYRSRINEIRKEGFEIETRPCRQHSHNSKTLQEWRLIGENPLNLTQREILPENERNSVAGQNFAKFPLQTPLF